MATFLTEQFDITAFQNNLIVCALTVLYMKLCLIIIARLRMRFHLTAHYTKSMIYICLSTTICFWRLFEISDWSWRLNCVVPCSLMIRYLFKGFYKDPSDAEVQLLSKSSSPTELLFGPVQICLVCFILGLCRFMEVEAAILYSMMIGDATAPITGQLFGRHTYNLPLCGPRTMEGSVCGVFLGTISASYFYLYVLGLDLVPLRYLLTYALVGALVEGSSPQNVDNLSVPLVFHFSMGRVETLLEKFSL